ncbi:GNAT family N-acetyltransferase [soil metagenome]
MITVRPIETRDRDGWLPLWLGYNAFYGREGDTALDPRVTDSTWGFFFDDSEPVWALVAEDESGRLLGLVHFLYHRVTNSLQQICYLEDLFTAPEARGRGVGKALIEAVYDRASADQIARVYWHTQETNATARRLYDQVATNHGFIVYRHDA